MTDIRIVEYNPSYAAGVATMWLESVSGWNGKEMFSTAERVRNNESSSAHLNLYLAVLQGAPEKVVGYCKLSKYSFDEGTLYIDLLNVVPDYHGAKIGKLLIKHAMARTVALGYPRLDLFTWPGNTKAIPLYKKCGFFWEKMDKNATHLMNFMPQVLVNPLVKTYFQQVDWYDHSVRLINREPDGTPGGLSGDFDYYTYTWEHAAGNLAMTFEKSGRGLVAIKAPDYEIALEAQGNNLVFGQTYPIQVTLANHGKDPIQLALSGLETALITTQIACNHMVSPGETQTIEGTMTLLVTDKEQDPWTTHPTAQVHATVDGIGTTLKAGVNLKSPLKMKMSKLETPGSHFSRQALLPLGVPIEIAIDLQNNFDHPAQFSFTLPSTDTCIFTEPQVSLTMAAKEKRSFATTLVLGNSQVLHQKIRVGAHVENMAEPMVFEVSAELVLHADGGMASGHTGTKDHLLIGKYSLDTSLCDGMNNANFVHAQTHKGALLLTPRVGLSGNAMSSELDQLPPARFSSQDLGGTIVRKHHYESLEMPGLKYARVFSLSYSGHLKVWFELEALPQGARGVALSQRVAIESEAILVPFSGRLLKIDQAKGSDNGLFDLNQDDICENWLMTQTVSGQGGLLARETHMALVWPKDKEIMLCGWFVAFDFTLETVGAKTEPIQFFIDSFEQVDDLRLYAAGQSLMPLVPLKPSESCYFEINGGNPVLPGVTASDEVSGKTSDEVSQRINTVRGQLIDLRQKPIGAQVKVMVQNEAEAQPQMIAQEALSKEMGLSQMDLSLDLPRSPLTLVTSVAEYDKKIRTQRQLVMGPNEESIDSIMYEDQGHQVYQVSNGVMTIKASPSFGGVLHSLESGGRQWVASDFPNVTARSWFSPWFGGLSLRPVNIPGRIWADQGHTVRFVKETDNHGNVWQGLAIDTEVTNFEPSKGLILSRYYLLLPGVPVMSHYYTVHQNTQTNMKTNLYTASFFEMASPTFTYEKNGETIKAKSGDESLDEVVHSRLVTVAVADSQLKLHHYVGQEALFMACNDSKVTYTDVEELCSLHSGELQKSAPRFYVLSPLDLKEKDFEGLANLTWP